MAVYTPQPGISVQGAGTDLSLGFLSTQLSSAVNSFFVQSGILYQLVFYTPAGSTSNQQMGMIKSVDDGETWAVMDAAHQPGSTAPASMVGGGNRRDASMFTVVFGLSGIGAALQLQDFNFGTDTWGAIYGAAGAPITNPAIDGTPLTVYCRPGTDDVAVIYFGVAGGSGMTLSVYDRGSAIWNVPADVGTNITALAGWSAINSQISNNWRSAFDGSVIYIFFWTLSSDPAWEKRVFFQAIDADNSTPAGAQFFDFPGQVPAPPGINAHDQGLLGVPAIVGGNIVLPVGKADFAAQALGNIRYASCWVGVGIPAVSSWIESTIPTDPAYTLGSTAFLNTLDQQGMAFFDGTELYIAYLGNPDIIADAPSWSQLRLCTTTPAGDDPSAWVWTAITATDYTMPPFSSFNWLLTNSLFNACSVNVVGSDVILGVNLFSGSDQGDFFLGNFGAPAVTGGKVFGTHVGFVTAGQVGGGTK